MDRRELITALEVQAMDDATAYLRGIPWEPGTPEPVKALIAAHVWSFYAWLMTADGAIALARAVRSRNG